MNNTFISSPSKALALASPSPEKKPAVAPTLLNTVQEQQKRKAEGECMVAVPPAKKRRCEKPQPTKFEEKLQNYKEYQRKLNVLCRQVKKIATDLNKLRKEEKSAIKKHAAAEQAKDDAWFRYNKLGTEKTANELEIERLRDQIDQLEKRNRDIGDERDILTDKFNTSKPCDEAQRAVDKVKMSIQSEEMNLKTGEEAVTRFKHLLREEYEESWRYSSGKDIFVEVDIEYTYEAVDSFNRDQVLALRGILKLSGFPPAQNFNLHSKNKTDMVEEICNAVGIRARLTVDNDDNAVALEAILSDLAQMGNSDEEEEV